MSKMGDGRQEVIPGQNNQFSHLRSGVCAFFKLTEHCIFLGFIFTFVDSKGVTKTAEFTSGY